MKDAPAMTRLRWLSLAVILLIGLLTAAPALASTQYPATIQAELGLKEAPGLHPLPPATTTAGLEPSCGLSVVRSRAVSDSRAATLVY